MRLVEEELQVVPCPVGLRAAEVRQLGHKVALVEYVALDGFDVHDDAVEARLDGPVEVRSK